MSMIKFSTSSENISSNGGFSFVSGILASIPAMSLWDRILAVHCNTRFSHQGNVRGAIGLMTAGCCDFADIEKFSGDAMFRHLVGKDLPSQETFRQRLNQLAETGWTQVVDSIAAALLLNNGLYATAFYIRNPQNKPHMGRLCPAHVKKQLNFNFLHSNGQLIL